LLGPAFLLLEKEKRLGERPVASVVAESRRLRKASQLSVARTEGDAGRSTSRLSDPVAGSIRTMPWPMVGSAWLSR